MLGFSNTLLVNCFAKLWCKHNSKSFLYPSNTIYKFSDCRLSITTNLIQPQPIILQLNQAVNSNTYYYLPENNKSFNFIKGENINITCINAHLILNSESTTKTNIIAKCVSDSQFEINKEKQIITSLKCTDHIQHFATETDRKCAKIYNEIEIKFNDQLNSHMISCFDHKLKNVVYSYYNLTSHISGASSFSRNNNFIESTFYNLKTNVQKLYEKQYQAGTINRLLDLPKDSTEYINPNSNFYLSRGHLTANRDFVYDALQRSTFYFINAAPQWQCFNGGNWRNLEEDLRNFASRQKLDLLVYTGTYGIATLPHAKSGKETELFLYVNDGTKGIPVPKFFWKFVYDPKSKKGIVFIGTNNPFKKEVEHICKDVSDSIKWLTWEKDNQTLGYSYACDVTDFRNTVNYLPQYEVKGLLY